MNREQHLAAATEALTKAKTIADTAEHLTRGSTRHAEGFHLAAVGTLYNDMARNHIELARELAKDAPEPTDD
ncbi:hypothetical protein [Streptomyces sp. GbtcB6]|uniref:hypothetical protein n=1 Tax=Streptomyces sp. GbtcB6 TaxID=2824751 RepID=UPI001C2F286E|nr:hypothetical protein [Streptomyces sp. GbtcB6]